MNMLIQRFHPALCAGSHLTFRWSGNRLFSRQGNWDSGSALHCAAMALAILGILSDPVDVTDYEHGPIARFWNHAWRHYLHGLTLPELASFIWELNVGVQPILNQSSRNALPVFRGQALADGWPVIVGMTDQRSGDSHAALAVGMAEIAGQKSPAPKVLLLLDPSETEPVLAACNARLEISASHTSLVTARATTRVERDSAVSIRLLEANATGVGCA